MAENALTVALAGNPNCGKTTIFNNLTGASQHVGNYPGVTVEKREGQRRFRGKNLFVIDLPGTYSLTANALDELVARNVIINEQPDIIVNILDASNLERNLYLAIQMMELERPVILALNMTDVAARLGQTINDGALEEALGVSVVRTVGNHNKGTDALLEAVLETATAKTRRKPFAMDYGEAIEGEIAKLTSAFAAIAALRYPLRWLSLKLLENDSEVCQAVQAMDGGNHVLVLAEQARILLKGELNEEPEIAIAERRYQFAGTVYHAIAVRRNQWAASFSDKLDNILTHRILGLPIFLAIMWLLFNFVFTLGQYPQDWIASGVDWLGNFVGQTLPEGELQSMLKDGVIGGVGTVLGFLPQILLLFLGISLLEDTGYMTRAAFVMDRVMRAAGLHGKSFIPLLLGFGCSVPAVMGSRTLENPRDRMVTILVTPFMSCSARLPVYTLLIAVFFSPAWAGTVLFSIYCIGVILAVLSALLFRKILFPGATEAFVMEMPPYHMPTVRSILTHMWERSVLYLKKAGTLILGATILVWFLTNYPADVPYSQNFDEAKAQAEETFTQSAAAMVLQPLGIASVDDNADLAAMVAVLEATDNDAADAESQVVQDTKLAVMADAQPLLFQYAQTYNDLTQQRDDAVDSFKKQEASEKLSYSYAGQFGRVVEPVIAPLGFDWKMGVGLVAAVAAKEVLVSTFGTIYSVGGAEGDSSGLENALGADPGFTPLTAYSLMIFTLLYSPCLATLAVIKRETNSWRWPLFASVYATVLAWICAFGVYQIGTLLGF